jgi:hypothetical protein
MEPDETPVTPARSTRTEPTAAPTEAELSRIAREAVRQPADPRLDRQLERMGLTDVPASPVPAVIASVADPALEGLERRLGRLESMVWVLVVAVAILAVAVLVVLLR